jgi:hypothetical protein
VTTEPLGDMVTGRYQPLDPGRLHSRLALLAAPASE